MVWITNDLFRKHNSCRYPWEFGNYVDLGIKRCRTLKLPKKFRIKFFYCKTYIEQNALTYAGLTIPLSERLNLAGRSL
jgi:hypothetical protein